MKIILFCNQHDFVPHSERENVRQIVKSNFFIIISPENILMLKNYKEAQEIKIYVNYKIFYKNLFKTLYP